MACGPKLTFSPACPFKPWDQTQQTQSHASRCVEGGETQGERERERGRGTSVRYMERVHAASLGLVTEVVKLKGTTVYVNQMEEGDICGFPENRKGN